MALADPQSVTINAVATSLPRIGSTLNSSGYSSSDGAVKLSVAHAVGKTRTRSTVRIDFTKTVPNPLVPSTNIVQGASAYTVIDRPNGGLTAAEVKDIVLGLTGFLTSATTLRVIGGES